VNRRVLLIAAAAGVCTVAIILVVALSSPDESPKAVVERRAPAAAPPPSSTARPSAPAAREAEAPVEETRRPESEPAAPAPAAEAAADAVFLSIETDVPGAQVFINREFVGTAPLTVESITPGTHQLNASAQGYDGIVMPIEVAPGRREISLRFREVRLDSAIDVVHRHGIGSCRGRLIATPAGIRYDTQNKDDAFHAALLDLEAFQVDYLAKNLRVRLPKGRQFNFTDPDGNADRLFVFHRDVERARERIRKGDAPAS
jgi:PEGA domain